jgi:hypothetical protein
MPYFKYLILIILSIAGITAQAQKRGYILIGKTAYYGGLIHFDKRNPSQVKFQNTRHDDFKIFKAADLTEFGYQDSTKFVPRQAPELAQTIFMEQLAEGELTILMAHTDEGKVFFIEQDNLQQLRKDNLRAHIAPHADFSSIWQQQLPLVRISKPSLAYFGRNVNKKRQARMSASNYGLAIGANISTIRLTFEAHQFNISSKYSMVSENMDAGLFFEMPIWRVNNLSIINTLSYGKMEFATSNSNNTLYQDINLQSEFIKLSSTPRYYLNANRLGLFLEAGGEFMYQVDRSSHYFHALHSNGYSSFYESDSLIEMPKTIFGYKAGAGLQFRYAPKHHINIGIHHGYAYRQYFSIQNLSISTQLNI